MFFVIWNALSICLLTIFFQICFAKLFCCRLFMNSKEKYFIILILKIQQQILKHVERTTCLFSIEIFCAVFIFFECVLLNHNMTTQISYQKSSDASKSHHENQNDLILNKYSYIFHFILNFLNKLNIYFVKYLIKF